jgi:DNA-binding SARP family transcriptional activator
MAGATQPASPSLRVTLAGGLAMFVADDPRPAALPAGKAVTLLAMLLARRGRQVPTDTIVEALWGESPPAKAEQNVASLVSRLRRIVGRNRIVGTGRGYLWSGDPDCRVDLDEAARLLEVAEADLAAGDASLASVAAGRALDLVGSGEVLADQPQAAWVDEARRDGARLLRRARECAWTAALALGEPQRGLDLAQAAVVDDPLDEPAQRALMLAQQLAGAPGAALATFERLRERLAEELGADPAAETAQLHLAILRGEPVPASQERPASSRRPGGGLVGRQKEFDTLRSAWAAAASGRAGLVLVAGAVGAGKSRLVEELAGLVESTGGMVAPARCYEAATDRTFFPRDPDALRAYAREIDPLVTREARQHLLRAAVKKLDELAADPARSDLAAKVAILAGAILEMHTALMGALDPAARLAPASEEWRWSACVPRSSRASTARWPGRRWRACWNLRPTPVRAGSPISGS